MRLFIAAEIGPTIAAAAGQLVEELRLRTVRLAPQAKVTWIPPERLHLTVRFIGSTDDERYRAIQRVLESPIDVAPFVLAIAGIGSFPKSGPPRVIWAGVSSGRDRLDEIEREVTARLEKVGIEPEDRAYSPHLTLARVRWAAGLKAAVLLERHRDTPLGSTRVQAITLLESRLSPKGPTYVPLMHTPLGRT